MILTLVSNECEGVIDFNGLLPIGFSVMLLPRINLYSFHLWGTHLMYVVVVHHMDDAGLMDEAGFLFFWTRVIFLLIKCKLGF